MDHPFKKYVDHIYVLTCIKYRNTRAPLLMDTLKSLGLSDMTDLMIQTGSPLDLVIKDRIDPVNTGASQNYVVDLFLNHYRAIKTGFELGYSNILILEDDAKIIEDQYYLNKTLSELPKNYICAVLDYGGPKSDYERSISACSLPSWGYHNGHAFNGAHGYMLDRTGMERWIAYCESTVANGGSKSKFDAADRIWPYLLKQGEHILFPIRPLIIQTTPGMSGPQSCTLKYSEYGVSISDYIPKSDATITVAYASDGNDYRRMEMSAFSVRKFMGDNTKIILLTDSEKTPNIKDVVKINPNDILSSVGFFSARWNRKWPYATLFRMAIPLLKELEELDRILYLDTDVLCRSGEANILKTVNLRGYEALASFDHNIRVRRNADILNKELCAEAKYELNRRLWSVYGTQAMTYVNAGVVLYNLKAIRDNNLDWYRKRLQWFWEAECRGRFSYLDQDFLNIMMDINQGMSKVYNWFGGDVNTQCVFQHFVANTKTNMEPVARSLGWS